MLLKVSIDRALGFPACFKRELALSMRNIYAEFLWIGHGSDSAGYLCGVDAETTIQLCRNYGAQNPEIGGEGTERRKEESKKGTERNKMSCKSYEKLTVAP